MDVSSPVPSPASRRLLIDGLNLAYWCGQPPSLRLPMSLMAHLLAAGHAVQLYFDASAPHRLLPDATLYRQLLRYASAVVEVPSGRSADGVLLRLARASGASIISRDHYGDHRRRYRRLIDDPTRLIPGWVRDDLLQLPSLGLALPLAASSEAAWQQLAPLLSPEQPPA